MSSFVYRVRRIPVKTRTQAFKDYKDFRLFHFGAGFLTVAAFLFYPELAFPVLAVWFVIFFLLIWSEYFEEPKKTLYDGLLMPLVTPKHFVQIGYEVPYEQPYFRDHLNALAKGGDELKAKEMQARKEPHRIIGFSKSLLGQHFLVIGTTGAGKTSLIMTLLKTVMDIGGGAIFVDGKGDQEMFFKCYRITEKQGRIPDFFVISFLEPEKVGFDTNTINPLSTLSAAGQVTFFMEVVTASSGGATGDKAYWLGRGKVLFQPIVYFNYLRRKYYGEPYSFETLNQYLSPEMFCEMSAMATAMAVALDERLKNSTKIARIRKEALKRYTPTSVVPTLEAILSYLTQFPHRQEELRKVGLDYFYADFVFKGYSLSTAFLKSLGVQIKDRIEKAGKVIYDLAKEKGQDVLSMSILELRQYVQEAKKRTAGSSGSPLMGKKSESFADSIPERMKDQYNYAQQQWDEVLQSLLVFSNVFGANDPDVDPVDVVKNARVLYVLLPSLSSDEKTRNMLGNIIVNAAKAAMSLSLGGKIDNLTATMARILTSVIKPEPIGLLILDEYGSYPVPGLSDILAQARSLKWSVLVGVQDLTSLRVGGTNEHSLKRSWANTVNKFIMKNLDKDLLDFLSAVMPAFNLLTEGSFEDADDVIPQGTLNVIKESFIDPKETIEYKNGFGILISDGKVALMQTFWADEKQAQNVKLNRFRKIV